MTIQPTTPTAARTAIDLTTPGVWFVGLISLVILLGAVATFWLLYMDRRLTTP